MKKIVLGLILFYQKSEVFYKPLFKTVFMTDAVCRFSPTCSIYTYQSIQKYGVIKGSFLGFKRIIRCHPWGRGGYDPVR